MLILFNNKFIKKNETKISLLSPSFMYGYGVFETLRTYGKKKVFKGPEHLQRLFSSAKAINLKIRHSIPQISKMLEKISTKSPHDTQRIKIIAIQEGIIIFSTRLTESTLYKKGVKCKTVSCQRHLPKVKSISYLNSYLSHEQAVQKKYYEAILLDKTGEIYEGAYSNIFWFEKNILCSRKEDVLEGITRNTVIQISPFKIKFKKIKLKELLKKKEIFLTQTSKGIVPIIQIDKIKINQAKVGKNTKKLIKLFQEFTKDYSKV